MADEVQRVTLETVVWFLKALIADLEKQAVLVRVVDALLDHLTDNDALSDAEAAHLRAMLHEMDDAAGRKGA